MNEATKYERLNVGKTLSRRNFKEVRSYAAATTITLNRRVVNP
jgi:hypothetical protein